MQIENGISQFNERESVVVMWKAGSMREIRGPGVVTGPSTAGIISISGFEGDHQLMLAVSLLNPNVMSVEMIRRS